MPSPTCCASKICNSSCTDSVRMMPEPAWCRAATRSCSARDSVRMGGALLDPAAHIAAGGPCCAVQGPWLPGAAGAAPAWRSHVRQLAVSPCPLILAAAWPPAAQGSSARAGPSCTWCSSLQAAARKGICAGLPRPPLGLPLVCTCRHGQLHTLWSAHQSCTLFGGGARATAGSPTDTHCGGRFKSE